MLFGRFRRGQGKVKNRQTRFRKVELSLRDLLGEGYVRAVCRARAFATGGRIRDFERMAGAKVDFFPEAFQRRLLALLPKVGAKVSGRLSGSAGGATTAAFDERTDIAAAPVGGFGYYRIGEGGRLHFISKGEHYHVSLGHLFPGYRLLESARALGIPNATHNNTRGHVTRLLEEELVRAANGIPQGDRRSLEKVLSSKGKNVLNRVLNLQTGSLACEAALKMMLARFHRVDTDCPAPAYKGRTPVFVVVGTREGALGANYHGTTTLTQVLRGMWPGFRSGLEKSGLMAVRAVRPDNTGDLVAVFTRYDRGRWKIAGFLHELVMMNYGGRRLSKEFVRRAYALCREHDVPTFADEIQSCAWSPGIFLFREYGIMPTFLAVGKGLAGGEYAASRILFNSAFDCLPQFGALVTNGQEEIASLAYLVTMRWVQANEEVIRAVGDYYQARLAELAARFPRQIRSIDGDRHMGAIGFHELKTAEAFARALRKEGLDISVQTYKSDCPPCALTKLPLIAGFEALDMVVGKMRKVLADLSSRKGHVKQA